MATRREKEKAKRSSVRSFVDDMNKGGSEFGCLELPEGVEIFKVEKTGTYEIDFLSYRAGKNNPRADEGMEHYERTYERHELTTPQGFRTVTCRKNAFGKKCAVCDWLTKYGGTADQKLVKKLRPKTRHLWVVNDDPGAKKPAFKIFDSSHKNRELGFAEVMAEGLEALGDDFESAFSHGKDGKTAKLKVKKQSFPGGSYNCVTRLQFIDRNHAYKESIDDVPCLDDLLADPGYNEIKDLLPIPDGDDGDNEEDERPSRKTKSRRDDDDDEDSDEEDSNEDDEEDSNEDDEEDSNEDDEEEDEDEDSDDDDEDSDEEDSNEDEDDEPQAKKSTRKKSSKSDDDDDDEEDSDSDDEDEDSDSDDEDEDEDEDEPKRRTRKPAAKKSRR